VGQHKISMAGTARPLCVEGDQRTYRYRLFRTRSGETLGSGVVTAPSPHAARDLIDAAYRQRLPPDLHLIPAKHRTSYPLPSALTIEWL
jgi:hypothetical protein